METKIVVPALVTIENITTGSTARTMGFAPYKENFTTYIAAGDKIILECKYATQVLYYLGQAVEGALKVTQAAKE